MQHFFLRNKHYLLNFAARHCYTTSLGQPNHACVMLVTNVQCLEYDYIIYICLMKVVTYHNEAIILPKECSHFLYKVWILLLPWGSAKRTDGITNNKGRDTTDLLTYGACLIRVNWDPNP